MMTSSQIAYAYISYSVTHMAEELPEPRKDLPKAIAAQIILGTLSKTFATDIYP